MRIKDLLEGKESDDLKWVSVSEDGTREPNFDVADDLVFFMNNDDDTYRRHTYPSIAKCIKFKESKRQTAPVMFEKAVQESYKNYIKKFPIRELPDELDEKTCKAACDKLHEEFSQHHNDGKYKG